MYFASQRAAQLGIVYEVTGPFRTDPPAGAEPGGAGEPAPLPATPIGSGGVRLPGVPDAGLLPGLRVGAARRASVRSLLRRGVTLNVQVSRPGPVTIALRTADLERVRGERGSTDRPRTVTLASVTRRFARAGRYRVTLRPRGAIRRRLERSGTITAHYTVSATDGGIVNRPVRLFARARRG
jgi:hypothetical protein